MWKQYKYQIRITGTMGLLVFAKELGIPSLHVYGDSFSIINWVKDKESLPTLNLDGWCHSIMELKMYFLTLDFLHVYKENNKREDSLSKEALSMVHGLLTFNEFYEGVIIGSGLIQLF